MNNSKKKELVQFTALIGIGGIISKLLSIPHSIIYAKYLLPSGFGLLQLIKVIVSYVGYAGLGIAQGMNRNVPREYTAKNFNKAKRIKDLTFTWFFFITFVAVLCLWTIYFFSDMLKSKLGTLDLILLSIIIILGRANAFVKPLLKADGYFVAIGKTSLINNMIAPIIGIVLVLLINLTGAIIALAFNQLLTFLLFLYFYRDYKPKVYVSWDLFKEQMSSGSLIFLGMFSISLIINLNLILIGYYYSLSEVGVFSFGLISLVYVRRYSTPIGTYFYREIMMLKDSANMNNDYFKRLLKLPFAYNFFFDAILLSLFSVMFFTIINLFLKEYSNSIPIIYNSIFGLIIYNSSAFLFHYLDATNQLLLRTVMIIIGTVLSLALTTFFLIFKYPLYFLTYSINVGFVFITLVAYLISLRQIFKTFTICLIMVSKVTMIAIFNTLLVFYFSGNNFILYEQDSISIHNILNAFGDVMLKTLTLLLSNYFLFSISFIKEKFMKGFNKNIAKIVMNSLSKLK